MKSKRRTISKKPAIVFSYYQYETIGCGGMIALKRSQARAVMVGFLTDEC
ncbi:hypothetical protein HW132_19945 [Brasilonema sp. CT11]|nr:hypothetical protein [Brasilonema sp. CT11]